MTTGTAFRLMAACGALMIFSGCIQTHSQDEPKPASVSPEPAAGHKPKPVFMDSTTLALKGDKLSAGEAAELEQKLSGNPEDITSLTMLLGYYSRRMYTDKSIRQKREKYILRLIANHPDAEVLGVPYGRLDLIMDNYAEAKKLWLEQLEKRPDDIKIIVNAAHFFAIGDTDLAIKYFERAITLDPKNARMWYWQLGSIYNLKGMFGDKKNPVAPQDAEAAFKNALRAYENAYSNSTAKEQEDSFVLKPIAESAFKSGDLDKAGEYANKMLAAAINNKKDGNLVYYGNFILGMIAVKKENIDAAGKYLLEAGKSAGSPQLNSFGPDMSLAQELLTRGKREIVQEFLKECFKFWKYGGTCEELIKEMENGGTPDLSMNGIMKMRVKMMMQKKDAVKKDAATAGSAPKIAVPADAAKTP